MAEPVEWPVPWQPCVGPNAGPLAWAEYLATRGALAGLTSLPRSVQRALVRACSRASRAVDRRRTRAAREFLIAAFGPHLPPGELDRRVLAAWDYFFSMLLEMTEFQRRVEPERVASCFELDLSQDFERARRQPGGKIVVTGHIGPWEAAGAVLSSIGLAPVYAVARPPKNRPMGAAIQRGRERYGMRLLHRHGAMNVAPVILRAGGTLALLLDQRGRHKPVLAPFFGRPALCERGAAVLVRRARVPVLLGACYRTERPLRYRLSMSKVLWPDELARASPEEVAARINAELERMILARPEQYFWLHDRFRGAPASFSAESAPAAPTAAGA